jgi:hypothetical protein
MTLASIINISKLLFLQPKYLTIALLLSIFSCNGKQEKQALPPMITDVKKQVELIYHEALPIELFDDYRVSNKKFYTGTKSLYFDAKMEFGSGFKFLIGKLNNYNNIDSLEISLMHLAAQKLKGVKVVWTIDDDKTKNIVWNGSLVENKALNTWEQLKLGFKINPEMMKANHTINIYVWNEGKEELWVDDFEINMFGRVIPSTNAATNSAQTNTKTNLYYDFEQPADILRAEKIGQSIARSGKMTCNFSNGSEYGIGIKRTFNEFGPQKIKKLSASIWVYPTEKEHDMVLTFSSVNKKTGELNFWHGKSTMDGQFPLNQWTILNSAIDLPTDKFNLDDEVEVGLWNKGKTSILCDDLHIVYGAASDRMGESNELQLQNNGNEAQTHLPLNYLEYDKTKIFGLNNLESQITFLKANFYQPKDGLESILVIKKQVANMWWFNQKNKKFDLIWETKDAQHFILDKNAYLAAGDFDGDNKADLLQVNKLDFSWKLYHFEAKDWILTTTGATPFPKSWLNSFNTISNIHLFNSASKTSFAHVTRQQIEVLQLDKGKWILSSLASSKNVAASNDDDILLDWNEQSYLKLNNHWRFDLKQVKLNKDGIVYHCNYEFKKDDKASNPKYYEYTALLSGNFLSPHKKQLLVCYFNCSNSDFNGQNCNGIENNIEFPNGISFYY